MALGPQFDEFNRKIARGQTITLEEYRRMNPRGKPVNTDDWRNPPAEPTKKSSGNNDPDPAHENLLETSHHITNFDMEDEEGRRRDD